MGFLRIFAEVAQEHRAATGATPSQQAGEAVSGVISILAAVVCLAIFVLVAGGCL